jgi:transcription initiation factor TFIID subunit 2
LEAAEQAHPTVVEPVKVVPRIISSAPKLPPKPAPSTARSSVEVPRQLSTQPIASSSRPTIKLKVGAQSKAQDEPSSKPAKRKTKISEPPSSHTPDAPPPPYVDDGSHDILQEVLAIEREKNQQRQRSISDKEKAVPSAIPSKRKKIDDVDDDDILELVAPVKKERPSPPEPSSSSSISIRKPAFSPSVKIKKDKVSDVPRPPTTSVSSGTSLKGKEKEVAPKPPAAGSSKPRKPVQYTPINEKKCRDLLKVLGRVPEAYLFARPVDPVLDGCPTCVFNVPIFCFCF